MCRLAADLESQWQNMTEDEMKARIADGRARCNKMLNSLYAGRGLSVRLTGHLYGMRARFHFYSRDYILADADCAYALSLDPFQYQVGLDTAAYLASATRVAHPIFSRLQMYAVNCSMPSLP